MNKEAMKLALEALEYIEHNYMSLPAPAEKAITALREALASEAIEQPAQRKPLSNEQIGQAAGDAYIAFCLNRRQTYEHALTRAIEAAHGIKENT